MSNIIKQATQVLCLQQVMLEILEQMPADNIFVQANKPVLELIESNVEALTEVMNVKQSDNYIYGDNEVSDYFSAADVICKNLHKVIDKIKGL